MFWPKAKEPEAGVDNAVQLPETTEAYSTAPEQQPVAPEHNSSVPEQHSSMPEQHSRVPEQDSSVPQQHPRAPEQHSRVPEQQPHVSRQHQTMPQPHSTAADHASTTAGQVSGVTDTAAEQTGVVPETVPEADNNSSSSSENDDSSHGSSWTSSTDEYLYADRGNQRRHPWLGNKNEYSGGRMDGRLRIRNRDVRHSCRATCSISKTMGRPVKGFKRGETSAAEELAVDPEAQSTSEISARREPAVPHLNVVVMVIGSRSEVQPFVKLAKLLHQTYGHRVRIATHPAFKDMIEKEHGLEFFSVGGEPSELLEYMVNNPGAISDLKTARFGKVGKRRHVTAEIFEGFWRSCTEASDGRVITGDEDDEVKPFIADCIMANPASYVHMDCAEALGIPLQIINTFPSTPTHLFPHPLAVLQKPHKRRSSEKRSYANFMSYPVVERKVWQGLGCSVNRFRANTLSLDRTSHLWASGATYRQRVPHTYLWSTGLVPKPTDWREEIDVSGFVFPDIAADKFTSPRLLEEFLAAGEAPIYIGFGSIVVEDGARMTDMIFEAVRKAGVRALVSKNWEGLGGDVEIPDHIHLVDDDVPYEWLFARVKACVIHGDAVTTASALKHALPTMVVPFFEDHHFWGGVVSRLGAGPQPISYRQLDSDRLAEGIMYCLKSEAKEAATNIGALIEQDGDGAQNAVKSLQHHMSLYGRPSTRCCIFPDEIAVWQVKKSDHVRLSPLGAEILVLNGYLTYQELRLVRQMDWNDHRGSGDPVSGAVSSVGATVGGMAHGGCRRPVKRKPAKKRSKNKSEKKRRRKDKQRVDRELPEEQSMDDAASSQDDCTTASISTAEDVRRAYSNSTAERRRRRRSKTTAAAAQRNRPTTSLSTAERDHGQTTSTTPAEQDRRTTSISTLERDRATTTTPTLHSRTETAAHSSPSRGKRTAWIMAKSPADLAYSSAQGLHNTPVLYGDRLVRKHERITGIRSGLRASGREFVYGFYDGFTGLVTQPVYGAKTDGALGFFKGMGKGLGGLVLKPVSAILSPIGYSMHGVTKQVERRCSPLPTIRHKRMKQGESRMQTLSAEERNLVQERVIKGWGVMRELQSELAEAVRKRGKRSTRLLDTSVLFADVNVASQSARLLREGKTIEEAIASAREYETNPVSRSTSS
ncbi:hypothetical protein XA68_14386 [Ophiocordyceps unilateralis]|uniref:Uncharacterized protein n=1 Tax=Ophiocordyceps unilateralis TaxID=268505 RepID=A0A2A9PL80_OPHUN|nr:hypothetical protein XA68_14386 [Ophiocordyceps unilateralis]